MKIYADNAATTRVSDTALAAMTPCFQEIYGNPSSLHTPGQRAAEKLAAAWGRSGANVISSQRNSSTMPCSIPSRPWSGRALK